MSKPEKIPSCSLPEEMLVSIIEIVPFKCKVRFISISKSFPRLIISLFTSTVWDRNHIQFLFNLTRQNQLTLYREGESPCLISDFPMKPFQSLKLVGSSDGFLCLKQYNNGLFLWNPFSKAIVRVPFPNVLTKARRLLLGFGYDSNSKDYKLIKVTQYKGDLAAQLYKLSTNRWRVHRNCPRENFQCHFGSESPVLVNGALHWLVVSGHNSNQRRRSVLSFDLGDEVFKEFDLPYNLDHRGMPLAQLIVFKELLHLVPTKLYWKPFSVWAMLEYGKVDSWVKLFNINFDVRINNGIWQVLGFRSYDEVLLVTEEQPSLLYDKRRPQLYLYKPENQEKQKLDIPSGLYYWGTYIENGTLLDT